RHGCRIRSKQTLAGRRWSRCAHSLRRSDFADDFDAARQRAAIALLARVEEAAAVDQIARRRLARELAVPGADRRIAGRAFRAQFFVALARFHLRGPIARQRRVLDAAAAGALEQRHQLPSAKRCLMTASLSASQTSVARTASMRSVCMSSSERRLGVLVAMRG